MKPENKAFVRFLFYTLPVIIAQAIGGIENSILAAIALILYELMCLREELKEKRK